MTNQNIEILLSKGYECFKSKKFSEANKFFQKAYNLNNDYFKTLFLLGITNAELNELEKARKYFYKAAIIKPNDYFVNYNAAKVYSDLDRDNDAIKYHEKTIEIDPKKHEAWLNYGLSFKKIKNFKEAITCFIKCLELNSNSFESYINLGDIYFEMKSFEKAISYFNQSLNYKPQNSKVITKIGVAYKNMNQFQKALDCHNKAIEADPNNASAYSNIGITYRGLHNIDKSIEFLNKALEIDPKFEPALINKAIAYTDLNDYELSKNIYLEVLKINPKNIEAANNLAMLYLSYENFAEGWSYFEKRWETNKFQAYIKTEKKFWDGKESLKKLLIVSEQGLGDQILYASMINQAKDICSKIYLTCDPKLENIFKNSFIDIDIISRNNFNNNNPGDFFDVHIPIGSLGKYFRNQSKDFSTNHYPYLLDEKSLTKKIGASLKKDNLILCGLSWKSNNKEIGVNKSLILSDLKKIINLQGFKFVNLQYGDVKKDLNEFNKDSKTKIIEHKDVDATNDILALASLIKNCNFVLTSSNTTAHLAGALNIPTIVIVPRGRGKLYYWTANKDKTLWYPSVKIFRQDHDFTWEKTITKVKKYIIENFSIMT